MSNISRAKSPKYLWQALLLLLLIAVPFGAWRGQTAPPSAQQSPTAPEATQGGPARGGRGGRGGTTVYATTLPTGYQHIKVTSSVDGTEQDSVLAVPSRPSSLPRPMVVFLHAWSVDDTQRQLQLEDQAEDHNWFLLMPNFRGHYDNPQACGSKFVQHDILDALAWVKQHYSIDEKRIYLLGYSGGGYTAMLMGSLYPQEWAAVSSWSGISNLADWYDQDLHGNGFSIRYTADMKACLGGAPTDNAAMAAEYKDRSPMSHLHPGLDVPFDLNAGGHDRIVSNAQTLRAFRALEPDMLDEKDTAELDPKSLPSRPYITFDPTYGREIYFRRQAANVRVTIYDGGHEMLPRAAFTWFEQFQRK